MATEMVEYRPGQWVKVVDGRIIGRATEEEVAAWRATARPGTTASAIPPTLDIDLDAAPPSPGRSLDVPLRPAFERRGRAVEPQAPGSGDPGSLTVETAITREAMARRHSRPSRQEPAGPIMVRRRLPVLEPAPSSAEAANPSPEVDPLPKQVKPRTAATEPAAQRRRQGASTSPAAPVASGLKPPRARSAVVEPVEEPEGLPTAAGQGPSYWWICNANHQAVDAFLRDWLPKYREKFGHAATFVLCHEGDLSAAQSTGLDAEVNPLLQPGHFYLGHEDAKKRPR